MHLLALLAVMTALLLDARARDGRARAVDAMMEDLTREWAARVDPGTLERVVAQYDFVAEAALLTSNNEFRLLKAGRHLQRAEVEPLVARAWETGGPVKAGDVTAIPVREGGRWHHAYWLRFRFQPPRSAYEPLRRVYVVLLLGAALSVVITTVLLDRWVLRGLDHIAAGARRVAAGDFSTPVPLRRHAGDEIDAVAAAFNGMMGEVGAFREDLQARVGDAVRKMRAAERNLVTAQRLAAVGTLAAGIAHDINNPLGGMMNAVRALARDDLGPEKRKEYLELVEDGLDRVAHTVQRVLQFSPHQVAPRACDLAAVADRALALGRHRVEGAGAAVRVEMEPGGLPVFGDPYELQQAVLNLVVNAADAVAATGRGSGNVVIRGERQGTDIRLSVEDDGVGMTEEQAAKAFDLFFTTKGVGEGTGLGLSIVHTIVSSHGGRVELRSTPGAGTTATIVLPAGA